MLLRERPDGVDRQCRGHDDSRKARRGRRKPWPKWLYTSRRRRGRVRSRRANLDRDGALATCDAMHLPHRQADPRPPSISRPATAQPLQQSTPVPRLAADTTLRCPLNLPHRTCSTRPTRGPTPPPGGSRPHRPNSRRPATSTSRPPTSSRSTSSSRKPATPMPGKPSAGRSARRPTRPQMRGGTRPRPTRGWSPVVSSSVCGLKPS